MTSTQNPTGQPDPKKPHLYVRTPGHHNWRTCLICFRGANAKIHRQADES